MDENVAQGGGQETQALCEVQRGTTPQTRMDARGGLRPKSQPEQDDPHTGSAGTVACVA